MLRHPIRRLFATGVHNPTSSAASPIDATALCSDANRKRCIERLQSQPPIRIGTPTSDRTAAVLLPLCTDAEGRLSLLYTLRSASLSAHTGQVSFPGGMRDAADASYEACAVRETSEEIGVSADQIEIWGHGQLLQPRDAPSIMPIVAHLGALQPSDLKLNPDEVAEAFTVPLSVLCEAQHFGHTQFRGGRKSPGYSIPVYLGGAHRIWGITAVLTHVFLTALLPRGAYGRRVAYVRR